MLPSEASEHREMNRKTHARKNKELEIMHDRLAMQIRMHMASEDHHVRPGPPPFLPALAWGSARHGTARVTIMWPACKG
jgi:hypothetical protein